MTSSPKGTDLEKEKKEGTDLTEVTWEFNNKLVSGDPNDPIIQYALTRPCTRGQDWLDDMEWGFIEAKPEDKFVKECESTNSEDGGEPKPDGGEKLGGEGKGTKRKREMTEEQDMSKNIPLMKAYAKALEMRPDNPSEFILMCVESQCSKK